MKHRDLWRNLLSSTPEAPSITLIVAIGSLLIYFCSIEITSFVFITSPKAKLRLVNPTSCWRLLALPQASFASQVSYPRSNGDLAVVSQRQSVITPQITTRSKFALSSVLCKGVFATAASCPKARASATQLATAQAATRQWQASSHSSWAGNLCNSGTMSPSADPSPLEPRTPCLLTSWLVDFATISESA